MSGRPTWTTAMGGDVQGGNKKMIRSRQISVRDLPGHLTLKTRHVPPVPKPVDDGLKKPAAADAALPPEAALDADDAEEDFGRPVSDSESDAASGSEEGKERERDASPSESSESSDEEDESDEEVELLRELERIKREREEERARKAQMEAQREEQERTERILRGNPLVQPGAAAAETAVVRRRWDDDVVFKNQARKEEQARKRFINDPTRNDFHKRFLERYIQ